MAEVLYPFMGMGSQRVGGNITQTGAKMNRGSYQREGTLVSINGKRAHRSDIRKKQIPVPAHPPPE